MANKTLGKTFIDNFQSQTQPQVQSNTQPLSTKAGLNKTKTTALQQGVLQALSTPQTGAMKNDS